MTASSEHTLEIDGKMTTQRFNGAAHYKVAACLTEETAKAMYNDREWCTAQLDFNFYVNFTPHGKKREREEEQEQ